MFQHCGFLLILLAFVVSGCTQPGGQSSYANPEPERPAPRSALPARTLSGSAPVGARRLLPRTRARARPALRTLASGSTATPAARQQTPAMKSETNARYSVRRYHILPPAALLGPPAGSNETAATHLSEPIRRPTTAMSGDVYWQLKPTLRSAALPPPNLPRSAISSSSRVSRQADATCENSWLSS